MYNWSINEEELKKTPQAHERWRLEQLINFGLSGERLSSDQLKRHWQDLNIDPARRRFLALLLSM